jgi:Ni,Fe-hydrogenase III small subunit
MEISRIVEPLYLWKSFGVEPCLQDRHGDMLVFGKPVRHCQTTEVKISDGL